MEAIFELAAQSAVVKKVQVDGSTALQLKV